ncbi:hypothetical protein [Primorskyibacter sp. 2E233]
MLILDRHGDPVTEQDAGGVRFTGSYRKTEEGLAQAAMKGQ